MQIKTVEAVEALKTAPICAQIKTVETVKTVAIRARAGSGGAAAESCRFPPKAWIPGDLSLSLARSFILSLSLSLARSLARSLILSLVPSLTHSLPLPLPLPLYINDIRLAGPNQDPGLRVLPRLAPPTHPSAPPCTVHPPVRPALCPRIRPSVCMGDRSVRVQGGSKAMGRQMQGAGKRGGGARSPLSLRMRQ